MPQMKYQQNEIFLAEIECKCKYRRTSIENIFVRRHKTKTQYCKPIHSSLRSEPKMLQNY